jgi:hypothetical protein
MTTYLIQVRQLVCMFASSNDTSTRGFENEILRF